MADPVRESASRVTGIRQQVLVGASVYVPRGWIEGE
jgi:hypothetical protein